MNKNVNCERGKRGKNYTVVLQERFISLLTLISDLVHISNLSHIESNLKFAMIHNLLTDICNSLAA